MGQRKKYLKSPIKLKRILIEQSATLLRIRIGSVQAYQQIKAQIWFPWTTIALTETQKKEIKQSVESSYYPDIKSCL